MPDEPEYPPTFASSDISSLLGQINDFAGVEPPPPEPIPPQGISLKSAKGSKVATSNCVDEIAQRIAAGDYVFPVNIIGSNSQRGPYLPGLRNILIGTSILRLAEQISIQSIKSATKDQAHATMLAGHAALGTYLAAQQAAKAAPIKVKK